MNTAPARLVATDPLKPVLPSVQAAPASRPYEDAVTRAPEPVRGVRDFDLRFRVDRDSGEIVVTIVNPHNGELLRQIPSEDALKLAQALESMGSAFLYERA